MKFHAGIIEIVESLPHEPGVYQYLDAEQRIIYVGKAKDLKKRVSSYFLKEHQDGKTRTLVKQIAHIRFTVVENELDALLLENNLIKSYRPRYNILLKDDKTYPWIVIKNEAFPRIFSTRRKIQDGSIYYGPYPNGKAMNALLGLIRELFQLRSCQLDLRPQKLEKGTYKVCLEYHIGKCAAPCVGNQSEAAYQQQIDAIALLLEGKTHTLSQELKKQMLELAEKQEFEQAQRLKEILIELDNYQSKSMMASASLVDLDVCHIESEDAICYFNYMVVREGRIVHTYSASIKNPFNEALPDIYSSLLPQLREHFDSHSKEILVQNAADILVTEAKVSTPKIGEKKQLLDLSIKNVMHLRLQLRKKAMNAVSDQRSFQTNALLELQEVLKLDKMPTHIECFDNSNLQGTNAVSACVVFKNGQASKEDYRIFNVKTVEGPDDFGTMKEVVRRRYSRLLAENEALPQLVIIDGGKGQLSAAMEVIQELGLHTRFQVIGLAKRLEEIFKPGFRKSIVLNRRSAALKLIQQLRDEAHRFGITRHRNKRSKAANHSVLEEIKGLGPKTIALLFQEFKTLEKMQASSEEEVAKKIGASKAKLLFTYFSDH
ncbi:MAG: hypothetical protein RLZZ301_800 [Bacteroidota bacterium]|jgi:excinuclease ABC subunit C